MIYLGSRYEDADITYVLDGRIGSTRATAFRAPVQAETEVRYWYWRQEDRIDILATQYYGEPDLWWRIMDANPEILDPLSIPIGTKIRIP